MVPQPIGHRLIETELCSQLRKSTSATFPWFDPLLTAAPRLRKLLQLAVEASADLIRA
jgi:hypothetical protein